MDQTTFRATHHVLLIISTCDLIAYTIYVGYSKNGTNIDMRDTSLEERNTSIEVYMKTSVNVIYSTSRIT